MNLPNVVVINCELQISYFQLEKNLKLSKQK